MGRSATDLHDDAAADDADAQEVRGAQDAGEEALPYGSGEGVHVANDGVVVGEVEDQLVHRRRRGWRCC